MHEYRHSCFFSGLLAFTYIRLHKNNIKCHNRWWWNSIVWLLVGRSINDHMCAQINNRHVKLSGMVEINMINYCISSGSRFRMFTEPTHFFLSFFVFVPVWHSQFIWTSVLFKFRLKNCAKNLGNLYTKTDSTESNQICGNVTHLFIGILLSTLIHLWWVNQIWKLSYLSRSCNICLPKIVPFNGIWGKWNRRKRKRDT